MKKFFVMFFLCFVLPAFGQPVTPDLVGTWKIVVKPAEGKPQLPSDYLLLMDDSIYTIGVDSLGNSMPGVSSGRWSVNSQNRLTLYPSDKIAGTRYYQPAGENRFKYSGMAKEKNKQSLTAPDAEIYLEKFIKSDE